MHPRWPEPLRPGDTIAVTAPSAGVPRALRGRLDVCVAHLERAGYAVRLGERLLDPAEGPAVVSAPARERAAELQALLLDPSVAAVVPPWGGELAVEVLPHLDWRALAAAPPTWLVGYSDVSTLLLPLLLRAGVVGLHATNLLDTPYELPDGLVSWPRVAAAGPGAAVRQRATTHHRPAGFDDWASDPTPTTTPLTEPGGWRLLDPSAGPVRARGRLVGGCLETVSVLAGSPYGDVAGWARAHAPQGTVVLVEVAEHGALDAARALWSLRLAGWFDAATAVLVGRTSAPDAPGFTQDDAVASALGDLGVPVVLDVDAGHVPPQLSLLLGAETEVVVGDGDRGAITQHRPGQG